MVPVRVLVADDNRDAADTLGALVEGYGGEARVCYDGPSAVAEAGRFRPDVCLLDLTMPGMDGDQVAAHIHDQYPDLPARLVAVTALGSEEARRRTTRAGFALHLIKPVEPDEILTAVFAGGRTPVR